MLSRCPWGFSDSPTKTTQSFDSSSTWSRQIPHVEAGSCSGWEVPDGFSWKLPRKKAARQGIAGARHRGQGCNTLVHLCANRSLCWMVFCSWFASLTGGACTRGIDAHCRCNKPQSLCIPRKAFNIWLLTISLTKAWNEWPYQAVFRPWHWATASTRAWKEWRCQAVFRHWHSAVCSTRAWNESSHPAKQSSDLEFEQSI